MKRLCAAACVLGGTATGLAAAPVSVDLESFEAQPGTNGLRGTLEGGFVASAQSDFVDDLVEEDPEVSVARIGDVSSGFTGGNTGVQSLTISRENGGAFDLRSLSLSDFYTGYITEYATTPAGGDRSDEESVFVSTIFDLVQLRGVDTAGNVTTRRFDPIAELDIPDEDVNFFELTELGQADLGAGSSDTVPFDLQALGTESFGSGFTDLVSLEFTSESLGDELAAVCSPENLARAPARFAQSAPCGSGEFEGTLRTEVFYIGPRNDQSAYTLESLVTDVEPEVAPVPLPAGLPLLAVGIAALGATGARRGRRAVAG